MTALPTPGAYLVIQTHSLMAQGIRLGCALGGTWSRFNHAAIYAGGHVVIEANPAGVQERPLDEYDPSQWCASRIPLTRWEQEKVLGYARSKIGTPYGWLDIVALAAVQFDHCPTWLERTAEGDDRLVCSQLVAYAYAAAGVPVVPGDPWRVTPGALADAILTQP